MSYDKNPFGDTETENPFADPAVQQNTWNQQNQGALDDFNPFDQNATLQANQQGVPQGNVPPPKPAPTQPAVMQATQEPPPPYTAQSDAQITAQAATDDLKRRQEELERKAEELQRKEQELQRNMGYQARINNFPPLPAKCCVQPCFYQDFELDIPLEFQKIVKTVYYLWIAYASLLLLNVIGTLAYFIAASKAGHGGGSPGTTFGVSILYLILFTPCSFVCWYRPLYKAFRSDSSFNFFLFFFVFFFQFCVCVIQSLGISGWGTVGFLSAMDMFANDKAAATIMILIGVLFAVIAAINIILLIRIHRIYRNTGASFAKAQQEFAQGVMSNKTVQKTAADVGAAAARGAVQSQYTDNRY
ncbi:hypothetical protein LSH36_722g01055 [Paralvinella palmiformis]|uniref:Secretory carrier-associated membrane protein n=1 Tax=Paralvinella palmiformis TaxID=53620 RepID=A0AAD9MTI5_9ANNE|nr:hypothetical protein LSH36_722g01055 [Paralvinella palmiformis]